MRLTTYVNFGGRCKEAFEFYAQHLGGAPKEAMLWKDMPGDGTHVPLGMADKVLHSRMELGGTSIMGADVPGAEPMRSAYLTLSVDSNEEAERIYGALAEGGEVFRRWRARRSLRIGSGRCGTGSGSTG